MSYDLRQTVRELRAENARLKALVEAADLEVIDAPLPGLTMAENSLVTLLYRAHPRYLNRYYLEENTPRRLDKIERSPKLIDVWVCNIRKKLGADAIENSYGLGYRLSDATAAMMGKRLPAP